MAEAPILITGGGGQLARALDAAARGAGVAAVRVGRPEFDFDRRSDMVTDRSGGSRVAILLSTYNGERFLPEQLASLAAQTHRDWVLFWRDDGSTDGTAGLLREFAAGPGQWRSVKVDGSTRIGPTPSFLRVLNAAAAEGFDAFAFADQDDVWLPDKLARGARALGMAPAETPALYCARQVFVDEGLARIGISCRLRRAPGFPAALTQNVATGCTLMLNHAAAALAARSRPPPGSYHDWWSYLLVSAAGGRVLADEKPSVLYRQHGGNLVGALQSLPRRALGALRRGPGVFMNVFRQQVVALAEQPHLLSDVSREQVQAVAASLSGGVLDRMRVLRRTRGLYRQTWPETLLFRAWFLIGLGRSGRPRLSMALGYSPACAGVRSAGEIRPGRAAPPTRSPQ